MLRRVNMRLPGTTTYVVSVDGSPYLAWQRRLLELSCAPAGVGPDLCVREDLAPVPGGAYPPANRPYALHRWMAEREPGDGQVCVLDPDMVLLRPVDFVCPAGELIGDDGRYPCSERTLRALRRHVRRPERVTMVIPPVIVRDADLARLVEPWLEITLALWEDSVARDALGWLCEMWAVPLAAQVAGLRVRRARLADVPPARAPADPLVLHYAWRTAHFDKRTYQPWADLSDHASSAYDPFRTLTRVARRASPEEAPIGA